MSSDQHQTALALDWTRGAENPLYLTKDNVVGHPRFSRDRLSSREWFCRRCGARVTQSSDRTVEYGHRRHCQHAVPRTSHCTENDNDE